MKRAQISEFIGIIVLILIFIVFTLYNSLSITGSKTSSAQQMVQSSKILQTTTGAATFSYVTAQGVPINELLGYAVCTGAKKADYGAISIDIDDEVEKTLNAVYGDGNWMLYLEKDKKLCFSPELFFRECTIKEDYLSYDLLIPLPCEEGYAKGNLFIK